MTGSDGVAPSDKWPCGFWAFHGLQSHSFPNCFFLGPTQIGATTNVPHALDEQSRLLAFIVDRSSPGGATRIVPTTAADDARVEEMRDKTRLTSRF